MSSQEDYLHIDQNVMIHTKENFSFQMDNIKKKWNGGYPALELKGFGAMLNKPMH